MRIWRSVVAVAAVVLAGGFVLGACSSDDVGGGSGYGTSDKTTAKQTTTAPAGAAAEATVKLGETDLGEVLTDAAGMTLYLYTPDDGTTSKVPAGVLEAWPPVVVEGTPVAGEGLDAAKLTAATQPNGQRWVAYDGHLLYGFTGDDAPGDVAGQGLGGVWYVVSASGEPIGA